VEICTSCQIVYETRNCPLCEAMEKIETLESDIEELRIELKEAQSE
jgi:hypothetical protein